MKTKKVTLQEQQEHYKALCLGEAERLNAKELPPFKDCCQSCFLVDWCKIWESIKQYDMNNSRDQFTNEEILQQDHQHSDDFLFDD